MKVYSAEDFVSVLAYNLDRKYPEEVMLRAELYAVVQGLLTSLRWSALRKASHLVKQGEAIEPIHNIETTDRFASEWMQRQEVVDRIVHTSGFPEELSESVLAIIEEIVDSTIRKEGSISIDDIGVIHSPQSGHYSIDLVKPLCMGSSSRMMAVGYQKATK